MAKAKQTISTSKVMTEVANRFNELPKKITKEVIADFLGTIELQVSGGQKVRIDRLGILQVKDRAARLGRNPQTGEEIKIPASKKVAFRAAKSLKDQVTGTSRKTAAKKTAKKAK